jgi:hypothetical protein
MGVAFSYRGYSTNAIPFGPGVLSGISIVAVSMSLNTLLSDSLVGSTGIVHYASASYVVGVFAVGSVAAEFGRRIGDHFACDVYGITTTAAGGKVGQLVRSASLVVDVELPPEIDDVNGYESVDEDLKRTLQGGTIRLPRRLDETALRDRIANRIERDFGVDQVSVELDGNCRVSRLAVGNRPDGISPSIPPGKAAVAVSSDPAPDASAGDPVEVWRVGSDGESLVATGSFRANVDDVSTVVVDETDACRFEEDTDYRLVTRPNSTTDRGELASVIWESDETVTRTRVDAGGPLEGEFVEWLQPTVLAIERQDTPIALPDDNETLEADDVVYVLGTPSELSDVQGTPSTTQEGDDGEPSPAKPSVPAN